VNPVNGHILHQYWLWGQYGKCRISLLFQELVDLQKNSWAVESTCPGNENSTTLALKLALMALQKIIFLLLFNFVRKPTIDGRSESVLTPLELLYRLSKLLTPPRIHKHRYCGVLAPNAKLRKAVIETAGPLGATMQQPDVGPCCWRVIDLAGSRSDFRMALKTVEAGV